MDGRLLSCGQRCREEGRRYVSPRSAGHFPDRYANVHAQTQTYSIKNRVRAYKREILLCARCSSHNTALYHHVDCTLSFQRVTSLIQALAEATREISRGISITASRVRARDELGTLVRSFNRMTEQLGEGRRQINEFTQSLEQAMEGRERRRKLMEAILENIPTGVVSLDARARSRASILRSLRSWANRRARRHVARTARRRRGA